MHDALDLLMVFQSVGCCQFLVRASVHFEGGLWREFGDRGLGEWMTFRARPGSMVLFEGGKNVIASGGVIELVSERNKA